MADTKRRIPAQIAARLLAHATGIPSARSFSVSQSTAPSGLDTGAIISAAQPPSPFLPSFVCLVASFAGLPFLLFSFFSFPHFPLCLDFFSNPSLPFRRLPCASPSSQAASGPGRRGAHPLRPGPGRGRPGGHEAAPELGGGRAGGRALRGAVLAAGLGGGSPAAGGWRRGGGRRGRGMRRGQPLQEEVSVARSPRGALLLLLLGAFSHISHAISLEEKGCFLCHSLFHIRKPVGLPGKDSTVANLINTKPNGCLTLRSKFTWLIQTSFVLTML
ncbi:unnamed protein product [Natator depressus]